MDDGGAGVGIAAQGLALEPELPRDKLAKLVAVWRRRVRLVHGADHQLPLCNGIAFRSCC
jgi:hypothetical protein